MPRAKEPILIIANPAAGASAGRSSRRRLLEWVRHDLQKNGNAVHIGIEDSSVAVAERAEMAARAGAPIVAAAGGDGTVNAVLNGIMRASGGEPSPVKLGILPLGTGNVFAYNMGIPKHWRQACEVLRGDEVRRIDVGLASPLPEAQAPRKKTELAIPVEAPEARYFVLMAGLGFDAKVIEDTSLRLKFVLRDFAYVLRSLQNAVVHQGAQMTLDFPDGRQYANLSWLMMVGNAASYAWNIKFTERAVLEDGYLDVCLFPYENKLVSVQQVMQLLIGQHVERGAVEYWKTKSLVVQSDPPVPVQLDGDEWGTTPLELTLLPGVLDVLAPAESTG